MNASPAEQTHPPTDSQKEKNQQKIRNETYPLYHGHVAAEITEKINPKILRQSKDYNQSKIKTYQKKKAKAIY